MLLTNANDQNYPAVSVTLRCPSCHHLGSFLPIGSDFKMRDTDWGLDWFVGHRVCPNKPCSLHVFIVRGQDGTIEVTYPRERIDFDTANIPKVIVECLEESISCHAAGCYKAAGMMLRKALEATCEEQRATGANLAQRIASLKTKVILPRDLLDALTELRLFGNDAAHIESKDYDKIGKKEVEAAIDLAKEILKALYQYSDLLKKLQASKKTPAAATP